MKKTITTITFLIMLGVVIIANADAGNTFNKYCSTCHTGGFKGWVTGAPEVGNQKSWQKFIVRDSIEKMHQIIINGENGHKVKGGCKKCSDDDIKATIDYMIKKSK